MQNFFSKKMKFLPEQSKHVVIFCTLRTVANFAKIEIWNSFSLIDLKPNCTVLKYFFMKYFLLSSLIIFLLLSCKSYFQTQKVSYKDYRLNSQSKVDSTVIKLLKPYSDSINKSMNDVIGYADVELQKKQPEGTLGNFITDAMLWAARKGAKKKVDAAFVNNGGIRLPSIAKGAITRSKIFELAPFDNLIVIQTLSGKQLEEFLSYVSKKGGWPVAGLTWKIKNGNATEILIDGVPIDLTESYEIANVDYVANGGDDLVMLKTIPQSTNGLLLRDAIIDYCLTQKSKGLNISAKIENRVTNAN